MMSTRVPEHQHRWKPERPSYCRDCGLSREGWLERECERLRGLLGQAVDLMGGDRPNVTCSFEEYNAIRAAAGLPPI